DAVERALAESRAAQARSDDLLCRAEETHERTRKLLSLPQEILTEANERTQSLNQMSKTLQSVIGHLSQLGAQADQRAEQLVAATASADDKLGELSSQSDRAAQLVALIRQLQGLMEQRADELRRGAGIAEQIARVVLNENPTARMSGAMQPVAPGK